MNLKKLLDLFEAPANLNYKGTAGTRAIQQATNQAKPGAIKNVNIIKPGQQLALPGGGSYTVKAGDTMDKIARSNPPVAATPVATTATAPVTNAGASSTDNETLKGQVITKAMSPAVPASVPAADSLSPGETVVDNPTPDTRGAEAMAVKSAPAADTRTSDQIATAQLNTPQSDLPPGRLLYGYVSEEDAELNELMRLSGRPVNEKAVSKQQQKFMGMVHAMQKGKKIKGASPELKKVAKTMSKKDAKDFASTKHKNLPTKVSESVVLEAGSALEHIINKFKHETKNFLAGKELDHDLFEALFDYYADNGEMPYGVAKARDGDPYQWIDNKFEQDLSMMGHQRDFNTAGLGHDHELTELARLAGLTNEDGPGSAMLNAPKKDTDSFADRMRSAGKEIRRTIDRATLPSAMHAEYDRIEAEKDKRATAPIATPSVTKADALTGTNPASAAERPVDLPTYPRNVKEDEELNRMRRIAGLDEARGAPEIGSKLPKSDVETFGLEPGRTYKTNPPKDWKQGDKPRALQQVIPTADKKDHIRSRLGKHVQPMLPEGAETLEECGDMSSQQDSMNVSTNMSSDGTKSVTITAQGDQAAALIDMLRLAGMDSSHVAHDNEPEIVMIDNDEEMVDEEYANEPEEEYQSIDSILHQGNDLNREKRQYAGKPKLGDNPMAESLLDADLDAMLESILIREEDSAAKKAGDAVKNPGDAAKEVGDKVKGRLSFSKDAEGKTSIKSSTGRIRATIDGNKTHYEPGEPAEKEKTDEGMWDTIKDVVGGIAGAEYYYKDHSPQLQALDKMRQQYKGTPYEKQVNDRYQTHLDRLQLDKGEVVDKKGEPIKVLPPDQWKGGNR